MKDWDTYPHTELLFYKEVRKTHWKKKTEYSTNCTSQIKWLSVQNPYRSICLMTMHKTAPRGFKLQQETRYTKPVRFESREYPLTH